MSSSVIFISPIRKYSRYFSKTKEQLFKKQLVVKLNSLAFFHVKETEIHQQIIIWKVKPSACDAWFSVFVDDYVLIIIRDLKRKLLDILEFHKPFFYWNRD